jgi:predicted dehydrogenase
LSAVSTSDGQRQAQAERAYPGIAVYSSSAELLEHAAELDVAVIAAPNRAHVALARSSLDAGLAVVVDKPLAATAAAAQGLIEHAARVARPLTVYQNRRWDGDFLTVRALLDSGRLGRVVRFESRFERWRPMVAGGWRDRAEPDEAGGLLYDLGSHLIDQALMLFGPAQQVYAELDRQRACAQVDDDSFVAITHTNGVRSQLWMSAMAAQAGPRFRVLGDQAAYVKYGLDPQEAVLKGGGRPEAGQPWGVEAPERWGRLGSDDTAEPIPTVDGDYPAFYRHLAAALLDGRPLPVDPRDAVTALTVVAAAAESGATGRVVAL